ncbi:MAG: HlyD family secretion protein [Lentisphaeraceae bacterium]|nr:HlyD family secretion protein [Lentisphaeraceae bacterium]
MDIKTLFSLISVCFIFSLSGEDYTIQNRQQNYQVDVRGTVKTLKSIGLMVPANWLPISYVVEDGSYVKENDVVAKFDSSRAEYELQTLLFEQKVVEQQLKYELNEIDNDRLGKEDKRDGIVDKLKIAEAELVKWKELPLEDEVLKAEGRLRIARLEYEAAEKEMVKAQDRYKRKFISKAELETAQQELKEQKVSLDYAKSDLEYESLPATKSTIKMAELKIENLKLEKQDIEYELKELKSLQDIEKTLAKNKKKVIEKKISMQKASLEKTTVKAPVAGYVKHMGYGSEKLGPGSKYFRGYRFADIPVLDSTVVEVFIPEQNRKFFQDGDTAMIFINGRKDKPVEGYVHHIYDVPVDIAEKNSIKYGSSIQLTGLKVYRAEVKVKNKIDWMRPGMNGAVTLTSSRKLDKPAVPIKFVKNQDEKNHISVEGRYKEVSGFMNKGWFFLDGEFTGKVVSLEGQFLKDISREGGDFEHGEFVASGEVVPTKSVKVVVKSIHGESKIISMKEEESVVKKGDVILTLDSEAVDEQITSSETQVADIQNQVDKLVKKLDLEQRENEFMIQTELNNLKIKEIERDVRLQGLDYKSTISAQMKYLQAEIAYENSVSSYKRLKVKNPEFISKSEYEKAERAQIEKKLQLELAKIDFEENKRGATEEQKSLAKRDYIMQKIIYENYAKEAKFKEDEVENELERLRLRLARYKFNLGERQQRKENLTIKAPADGLIRYEKVYDNGRIQKISLGVGLHSKMVPMTLPDLTSLTVRVKVPERYFTKVKAGMEVDIRIPAIGDQVYKGSVKTIEYIFESLASQDNKIGIYSSQEPLGQNVFLVDVNVDTSKVSIKPGVIADIYFPFER